MKIKTGSFCVERELIYIYYPVSCRKNDLAVKSGLSYCHSKRIDR